jgi:hypothetical protein
MLRDKRRLNLAGAFRFPARFTFQWPVSCPKRVFAHKGSGAEAEGAGKEVRRATIVFDAIHDLITPPDKPRRSIRFRVGEERPRDRLRRVATEVRTSPEPRSPSADNWGCVRPSGEHRNPQSRKIKQLRAPTCPAPFRGRYMDDPGGAGQGEVAASSVWCPRSEREAPLRPSRLLNNPLSVRLLKKVQMQGGTRCEARDVLSTYVAAPRERDNAADGPFSAACQTMQLVGDTPPP